MTLKDKDTFTRDMAAALKQMPELLGISEACVARGLDRVTSDRPGAPAELDVEPSLPMERAVEPSISALGPRISALGPRISALGPRISVLGPRISALGPRISVRDRAV